MNVQTKDLGGSLDEAMFDEIYATDLRYLADCWKLCGDAHCCSFSRYKSRFKMIARTPFQELPLLPNEYEYLTKKGLLQQFGDHQHKVVELPLRAGVIRAETIVSRRPGCACDQATRPTICRLYPLIPVYDVDGKVVSAESVGIYEALEDLEAMEPACRLTSLPFAELQKFFGITAAIARSPLALFYMMAYRITKAHVRSRVEQAKAQSKSGADAFVVFERLLLRQKLTDQQILTAELDALAEEFDRRYGADFSLQ